MNYNIHTFLHISVIHGIHTYMHFSSNFTCISCPTCHPCHPTYSVMHGIHTYMHISSNFTYTSCPTCHPCIPTYSAMASTCIHTCFHIQINMYYMYTHQPHTKYTFNTSFQPYSTYFTCKSPYLLTNKHHSTHALIPLLDSIQDHVK